MRNRKYKLWVSTNKLIKIINSKDMFNKPWLNNHIFVTGAATRW